MWREANGPVARCATPLDVRLVLAGLLAWLVGPIDLIPESIPVLRRHAHERPQQRLEAGVPRLLRDARPERLTPARVAHASSASVRGCASRCPVRPT